MPIKKKLLCLTLSSLLLLSCSKKEDKLTVGCSIDYPPFEFFKNGEVVGFDVDLINEIAKRLNKKIEIKDMPFDSIIGSLQTGRIDMAISSISPTIERQKAVSFSSIYHKASFAMVSHKKAPVNKLSELKTKTLGVQLGSIYENYFKETLLSDKDSVKDVKIRTLTKIPDILQDLKSGRMDAVLMGEQEAKTAVKNNPDLIFHALPDLELSTTTSNGVAIAMPKNSPLLTFVNEILEEMKKDGTLEKLHEKWFL